jgi:histidinol-phosphatase
LDELTLGLELADLSDEISMKYFSRNPETSVKLDGSLVTVADREIEAAIRTRIRSEFPDHAILGEESGLEGSPDAPMWIIDPIDGTNNYAAGIPVFGTLIGLRIGGRTEVGVASAPALGERYAAAAGDGARMNGKPISVSPVDKLSDATVCIGSYRRMVRYGYGDHLAGILKTCRRDRGFGDFWGYMLVARGAAEVMMEPNLNVWDIAALEVIVREAGGKVTGFAGEPYPESRITSNADDGSFLCTNGLLHDELVERLRK